MSGTTNIYVKVLYYFAKLFGLAPFTLKNNRLICNSLIDKVLPIIYISFCLIALGTVVIETLGSIFNASFAFNVTSTYSFGLVIDYVGTATCLIIFFRNKVRIFDIIELFNKLDVMFEKLSIVQNYDKAFSFYAKFVVPSSIFLITCYTTASILTMKYIHKIDVKGILLSAFAEIIGRLIRHHVIVIFVIAMLLIAERLRMLNECLEKISFIVKKTQIVSDKVIRDINKRLSNFPSVDLDLLKKINEFGKLNDIIRDMIEDTIKFLSLPLLMIILYAFWRILMVVYFCVRNLVENQNFESLLDLILRITDIAPLVLDLLAIAFVCNKVQSLASGIPTAIYKIWLGYYPIELMEGENSKALSVYKLWIKFYPIEFKDELQMLSLQLLQRPLKIAAFGFFSLDYSYLYTMSCAIIAYLVIMVQLDPSKDNAVQELLNQTRLNITNE